MKKTLIATAILATLAATSANAGVTVFQDDTSKVTLNGRIHAGMKNENQLSNKKVDGVVTSLEGKSDNTSDSYFRLGLAGESVLSEGLTAIANLEMQWDIADSGEQDTTQTRLAYAGVKGDFGQVTFGRQQNVDVTVSDWIDNALLSGDTGYKYSEKESNVIQYNGTFDALFVAAQIQLENDNDENDTVSILGRDFDMDTATGIKNMKKSDFGLTAVYTFDFGLDLGATYMDETYKGETEELKVNTLLLGANYKVAGFTFGAVYGMTDIDDTDAGVSSDSKAKGFGLSAAYEFDKVTVLARYNKSKMDLDGATSDYDLVKEYTIGARYDFNANFNLMAEYKLDQLDSVDDTVNDIYINHENEFYVSAQYNF